MLGNIFYATECDNAHDLQNLNQHFAHAGENMVRSRLVSKEEILTDNPTMCLSPLRYFDLCHMCINVKKAYKAGKDITRLRCKPRIQNLTLKLLEKRRTLVNELMRINKLLGWRGYT